jgi:hypothetical protein
MFKDAIVIGEYRYELVRCWAPNCNHEDDICNNLDCVVFIMLNPSIADADIDDPTIRRCIGFARAWGKTSLRVYNIFALRATDPVALQKHPSPIGPLNKSVLADNIQVKDLICAWGNHGSLHNQGQEVKALLESSGYKLKHLGLTKGGHPKHPLYLRADTKPIDWI